MKKLCILLLLFATPAQAVDFTITVSAQQATFVQDSRAKFNARTGQSLSVTQWIKYVIREAAIAEHTQANEATASTAIGGAFKNADTSRRSVRDAAAVVWGLPLQPTPVPTPPTPTIGATPTPVI